MKELFALIYIKARPTQTFFRINPKGYLEVSTHRVFQSHEAVAHPSSCSPISADVGEGLVIVTVRSAE